METNTIKPISESLAKSFERLFRAGGFALAFGFAGLVLILVADVTHDELRPYSPLKEAENLNPQD